jgi:hypothetical protein
LRITFDLVGSFNEPSLTKLQVIFEADAMNLNKSMFGTVKLGVPGYLLSHICVPADADLS